MIAQKHQCLAGFGIPEADTAQLLGVILAGVMAIQGNGLVADDAGRAIRRRRVDPMGIRVRFGARHEEGPRLDATHEGGRNRHSHGP